jgi:tetratricopeptide (TPR) repeat protein
VDQDQEKSRAKLMCLLLAAVTLALYWPVQSHEFINYDDPDYVLNNQHLRDGLSLEGILRAFTHSHSSNWHPLTWISHMVDCELFGLNPAGHHVVNLLWHTANTLLLFLLLRRLTGGLWRSAFVAALFAWHPLHVESVAWISERKDVLSTFFWLATTWAYTTHVARPTQRSLIKVIVLFAMGLMSKPMLVTLPFTLLLLDVWPLRRLDIAALDRAELKQAVALLVREKFPLFVLALVSSTITLLAQEKGGAVVSMQSIPLVERLVNAVVSYAGYLGKLVWPVNLAIFYPYPGKWQWWQGLPALALLSAVTVFALKNFRARPYLAIGWLWYLGTLVPVIGLVQVGMQSMADRYTYVPLLGIFLALGWEISHWAARWRWPVAALKTAGALVLIACAVLTRQQILQWKDTETVFTHALRVTRNNFTAHINLGNLYFDSGLTGEAMGQFNAALQVQPDSPQARYNIANVLLRQGRREEAIARYREALQTLPDYVDARMNLGIALVEQGKVDEALAEYATALQQAPNNPKLHNNAANALLAKGKWDEAAASYWAAIQLDPEAIDPRLNFAAALADHGRSAEAAQQYQAALRLEPDSARAHNEYGLLLANQGNLNEAIQHCTEAVRLKPDDVSARMNLGMAFLLAGNPAAAIEHFGEGLRLRPQNPRAHSNLAYAFRQLGRTPEAIRHFEEALRLQPDLVQALHGLAWLLATHPQVEYLNGPRAVDLAQRAVKLTGEREPMLLDTLGAAQATAGQFDEAVVVAQKALALAGQGKLAAEITGRLQLYQQRQPFREKSAPVRQ